MQRILTLRYEGFCPYTQNTQAITIDYFEFPITGSLTPGHKKRSYSCPDSSKCQCRPNRCPVYMTAPHTPAEY